MATRSGYGRVDCTHDFLAWGDDTRFLCCQKCGRHETTLPHLKRKKKTPFGQRQCVHGWVPMENLPGYERCVGWCGGVRQIGSEPARLIQYKLFRPV